MSSGWHVKCFGDQSQTTASFPTKSEVDRKFPESYRHWSHKLYWLGISVFKAQGRHIAQDCSIGKNQWNCPQIWTTWGALLILSILDKGSLICFWDEHRFPLYLHFSWDHPLSGSLRCVPAVWGVMGKASCGLWIPRCAALPSQS